MRVHAVAFEAMLRQHRPDVAVEINSVRPGRQDQEEKERERLGHDLENTMLRNHGVIKSVNGAGRSGEKPQSATFQFPSTRLTLPNSTSPNPWAPPVAFGSGVNR